MVDRLAGIVVRGGGLLVIVAVIGILVFLVATVLPLFRGATTTERPVAGTVPVEGPAAILALDEYRMLGLAVGARPEVVAFRADDGQVVHRYPLAGLEGATIVGGTRSVRTNEAVLATSDGRLAFLTFGFASDFVLGAEREPLLGLLGKPGDQRVADATVIQRMAGGNFLRVRPDVALRGIHALPAGSAAIVGEAYATHEDVGVAVAATADGRIHLVRESITDPRRRARRAHLGDGRDRRRGAEGAPGPLRRPRGRGGADRLVRRPGRRHPAHGRPGRPCRPTRGARRDGRGDGAPARIAAAEMVLGGRSIAIADARGDGLGLESRLRAALRRRESTGRGRRGSVRATARPSTASRPSTRRRQGPIRTLASGQTRRTLYIGHESGSVSVAYTTNGRVLASTKALAGPVIALAPGPKDDGFLVSGGEGGFKGFDMDCPHPETGFDALFGKVHYEGYDRPEYLWQSSSATDESELKLSLTPLVFGTLKATFYAMLFALPLALLAALYTSQFMHPRVRALVKPGDRGHGEPAERGARLPRRARDRAGGRDRSSPPSSRPCWASSWSGSSRGSPGTASRSRSARASPRRGASRSPARSSARSSRCPSGRTRGFSAALFSGTGEPDRRLPDLAAARPDPRRPRPGGGHRDAAAPRDARRSRRRPRLLPAPEAAAARGRGRARSVRCVRFLVHVVLPGAALALLAGPIEALFPDGDFRRFLLGTKEPGEGPSFDIRNSLVVGIAMGFAVIPVIYTIAEDALSAIPDSLRSAALGCGREPLAGGHARDPARPPSPACSRRS